MRWRWAAGRPTSRRCATNCGSGPLRCQAKFEKYRDIDPDWADLGLVCPAESSGLHRIARLHSSDFKVYRIHGRKRFALELLG